MRKAKAAALEAAIVLVENAADRDALMPMWKPHFDVPPPRGSSLKMMKLAIAYQLQAKTHGGLKTASVRYLYEIVSTNVQRARLFEEVPIGTRLLRQWHGQVYEGVVEANGVIVNDRHYRSLSEAARTITGVHWSGPRFFGIRKVRAA
jgi:hypothetical protein